MEHVKGLLLTAAAVVVALMLAPIILPKVFTTSGTTGPQSI